ncbi:hypothetical protein, partial [Eubacterium callanderi]|uniref:hypothetical protein n=1 Tax=Eubacterium callanderi TaxID=53442 RepID=UPI001AA1B17A
LVKSVFLALTAALTASNLKRISIPILTGVVTAYQVFGTFAEWILTGNFFTAVQDFRLGIPGMLLQIFGGYFI